MKRILITGANSFIGANFRKYSYYKEAEEISLIENNPSDIDFGRFDIVLHLAALVHQSKKIPESEYFHVNRDLCLQVAEYAKSAGVRHFIFLSTLKVYGEFISGLKLRDEYSECFPDDSYGKSKYEAEIGLKSLETPDFVVSIVRTPLVYGEGVKANMLSIIRLVDYIPLLPFGNAENRRNYTYTENLVGFIDRIIEKNISGVFIAMDEKAISTTELVAYLSNYLGRKSIFFKVPSIFMKLGTKIIPSVFGRLFGSLEFDNSKTLQILNYKSLCTTEEGLKRMVAFYLAKKKKTG